MQNDIKTKAYVLKRTNYGEADRILNIITPRGKMSVIAKGVRKEKSKLAGGIELFSLVELIIHQGKSEFGLVTSAKMVEYFSKIVTNYDRTEFAAEVLKKISKYAEGSDNPEFFSIADQSLRALNGGVNNPLIRSWFLINLMRANGEEVNLYRDIDGEKLTPEKRYSWDLMESAFIANENGNFGANEIKMLRLMMTSELRIVARVKNYEEMMPRLSHLAEIIAKQ